MKRCALSRVILYTVLISLVWLTGCTEGQPESPQVGTSTPASSTNASPPRDGGELVLSAGIELPPFDPLGETKQEAAYHPYETLAYRGLLSYSENGTLIGEIASDYRVETVQGKPSIVLTLRKGALWPDRQPITIDDVQFTLETYARYDYFGVWRQHMHLVQGVSPYRSGKSPHITGIIADAQSGTIRINLERNDQSIFQTLTAPLLAKHQAGAKSLPELRKLSQDGKLLGAGPFQLKEKGQDNWRFVANESFYGGKPHLASIQVVKSANPVDDVKAGKIHWSYIPPDAAQALSADHTKAAGLRVGAGSGFHFLGFNLQSNAVSDLTVRKALAQAVSVEQLVKEDLYGFAQPVKSPLPRSSFAYSEQPMIAYDREAAKKALADKGYSKEKPLTLSLVYPSDSAVRKVMVDRILSDWAELPVKVEPKALEPADFTAYLFGGEKADLYLYAWKYPDDPAQLREVWHSREKVGERGLNASRFTHPEADKLLDTGQLLLPVEERKKLFATWQKILMDHVPLLPLAEIQNPYYVSTRLHGPSETPGSRPFADIHAWWLE